MIDPLLHSGLLETRRQLFHRAAYGIGAAALGSLLNPAIFADQTGSNPRHGGLEGIPHFAPKAKRVIYLLQSGAPSQVDLLDYKASLEKLHMTELPDSVRSGQRLTGMTSGQKTFPVIKSPWKFVQCGKSGTWLSELLPHMATVADDICVIKIKSMHTEAINHDPGITFFQTGHQQPGRPSIGAWLSYGLGSQAENLPAFVVLLNKNTYNQAQPIYDRLWGSGFRPTRPPWALFERPWRDRRRTAPRHARSTRQAERPARSRDWRSGNHDPDRAVRNGVPHADFGARTRRSIQRAGLSCTARKRNSPAPMRPIVCWPGGWRSAACVSFRYFIAIGITTPTSLAICRSWRNNPIKARRRWYKTSSSAACSTTRW
jgi:hypothetical protein